MVKTTPDYGNVGNIQAQPDVDNTELAVRIGSPVSLRRSGRVIYYDLCNSLFPWSISGGPVQVSSLASYHPGGCFQILASSGVSPTVIKAIPRMAYNKLGLSCLANICQSSGRSNFFIELRAYYGNIETIFSFRYEFVSLSTPGNLSIFNNGSWVVIDTYPPPVYNWINFKIIIDTNLMLLRKLSVNERDYDLTPYQVPLTYSVPNASQIICLVLGVDSSPSGGGPSSQWSIGEVIFTSDEP